MAVQTRQLRLWTRARFLLFLLALNLPWLTFVVSKIRGGSDFLSTPDDPEPGGSECWRWLGDLEQMAHYAVVAGYLKRLAPGGSVLDVGCGYGILARDIGPFVGSYLGIDRDHRGIDAARSARIENAQFEVADAQDFNLSGSFDAIIFNECLYYLRDPIAVLRRYARAVTPNGIIVVSIVVRRPALRLIQALRSAGELLDETIVLNDLGIAWVIQALKLASH
jgi:2-polyprenyl-3-methyl-5-hydroxy-6-metoxy-1,4-benzoquinol methylase